MEKQISVFFSKELTFYDYGVFQIEKSKFLKNSNILKIEILKKIINHLIWKIFSPKKKPVLQILKLLKKDISFVYTLHTCLIKVNSRHIKIYKEILNKKRTEKFF